MQKFLFTWHNLSNELESVACVAIFCKLPIDDGQDVVGQPSVRPGVLGAEVVVFEGTPRFHVFVVQHGKAEAVNQDLSRRRAS